MLNFRSNISQPINELSALVITGLSTHPGLVDESRGDPGLAGDPGAVGHVVPDQLKDERTEVHI